MQEYIATSQYVLPVLKSITKVKDAVQAASKFPERLLILASVFSVVFQSVWMDSSLVMT